MVASTQNGNYQQNGYYYGQNSAYNVQLAVPLSVSCQNTGSQLWATGTVYDTVTGQNLGSTNAIMNMNNGIYSGQLTFNLPSSVVEQQLQVQVQVYNGYNNGQYTGLVGSSSPTVTIHASSLYNYPSTNYPSTSYYNGYPTGYYNGYYYYSYPYYYPSYSYYNSGYSYYYSPYYYYYPSSYYSYSYYPSYYHYSSCYNGQTIVYYNGAYYYASCYSYYHHH